MNIETDYIIDLQTEDVFKFIFDNGKTEYTSALPFLQDYVLSKKVILVGTAAETEETTNGNMQRIPLEIYGQIIEYYSVFVSRTLISNFNILIRVKQKVLLEVTSHLLIKNGTTLSQQNEIENAFSNYDRSLNPNPIDYASQKISDLGYSSDIFAVKNSFRLTKDGNLFEDRSQIDRILAIYKGIDNQSFLTVFGNDARMSDYFKSRKYNAVLNKREPLYKIVTPLKDELHEQEGVNTSAINNIIKIEQSQNVTDCNIDPQNRLEIEISTILGYPEFKTEWSWKIVSFGCFKTKIYWPTTFKRMTKEVLFAYIGKPENIPQYIIDEMKGCAKKAALNAAVIGVVFLDITPALVAFKTLFIECVQFSVGQIPDCLFPGLFILKEKTDWTRL